MSAGATQALRERDAELEMICSSVDAAAAGQGQLVVVEGPAGIGKSSLLRAARDHARDAGIRCLTARGSELESRFPFGMVHQLLDDEVLATAGGARDRLFSGPARAAGSLFGDDAAPGDASPDALYQLLHGLYWLTTNVAASEPLAIVFDDAQWADEASLEYVSFLARRIEKLPLVMVVGTRPVSDQGRPLLAALTTDAAATVVRPAPLTRASVDDWVRTVLSDEADAAFVDACHASTSGNPFLVHELLREVAAERLRPTAAEAHRVGALAPGGVSAVVGLRMANMPAGSVQLARAAAVLGDGTSLSTAAALAGLDESAAGEAATALVRAGIVESRAGLTFTHPVVRATVYEQMDPAERSAAHARAASLLRSRLATADQIAAHLLLTEPRGDGEVVDTLTDAAERAAAVGALDTARAYLERALAEPPPDRSCSIVLTDLGRVEGRLGLGSAPARLEQAMDVAGDVEGRARAALELGRILKFGGEGGRGVDVLEPFVEAEDGLDPDLKEQLQLEFLGLGWLSSGARRRLGERVNSLEDPGDPVSLIDAFVLAARGFNDACSGVSAERAAEQAMRAANSGLLTLDPAGAGGYGMLLSAVALKWSDRYAESERLMDRMLREARRVGNRLSYVAASSMLSLLNMRRGALLEADRHAAAAIDIGREIGGNDAFLTAAWATYGDVGVDRGLPDDELRRRLVELEASEHDADALPYGLVLHAKGRLEVALGDLDAGLDDLRAAGRRENSWGAYCPSVCSWRTSLALAYRDAGQWDAAVQIAAEDLELSRRFGAPRPLGMALRAHALAGGADDVVDGLREAVAVLEGSSARLELARALTDLGAELRRRGQADRAADILRRGQELATRCGARGVAQIAHDELLAAGAEPAPIVTYAADALEPGERRIAELAVRGADEQAIARELLLPESAVAARLRSACDRLGLAGLDGLAAALVAEHEAPVAGPAPVAATPAEAVDYGRAVRDALRDFDVAHRVAANPLAPAGGSLEERADAVRALVREAVEKAFGAGPGDQLMRDVLVRGYLEGEGSHEQAADELHISRSTYYRRLREGTQRVVEYFETASGQPAAAPTADLK